MVMHTGKIRSCKNNISIKIDLITAIITKTDDISIFQKLCTAGKAIVVVAESSAFAPDLLSRLRQLCDTHISMMVRDRQVRVLNAVKVNNLEQRRDNGFSFRVEPGVGITIVPMFQVRV